MKSKKLILSGLGLILSIFLIAQTTNLVLNPSFENYKTCPDNRTEGSYNNITKFVYNWQKVNTNKSCSYVNYYNTCVENERWHTVPENIFGEQFPKTGNAYISLTVKPSCSQYVAGKLINSLIKSELYLTGFFISLADYSPKYINNMGLLFSDTLINNLNSGKINISPSVRNFKKNLNNVKDWSLIHGLYKAKGNEKYITIGSFYVYENVFMINELSQISYGKKGNWSDFYIDDVFTIHVKDSLEYYLKVASLKNKIP